MNRLERAGAAGHEDILNEIENLVDGLTRNVIQGHRTGIHNLLNQCFRNLERLRNSTVNVTNFSRVERKIINLQETLTDDRARTLDNSSNVSEEQCVLQRSTNGNRGPGRYQINRSMVEHLLDMGSTVKDIAEKGLLGKKIHPNTLHNFIKTNGIQSFRQRFTVIQDTELTSLICNLHKKFPNSGIREMKSMLKCLNPPVNVQRDRVARILAHADPAGTARRWAQVIPRRVYSVPTPNSLWHLDTHHSCIRYCETLF